MAHGAHEVAVALLGLGEQHDGCGTTRATGSGSSKQTESCTPAMGWMPEPASFSENSSAPNRLLVSVGVNLDLGKLALLRAGRTRSPDLPGGALGSWPRPIGRFFRMGQNDNAPAEEGRTLGQGVSHA